VIHFQMWFSTVYAHRNSKLPFRYSLESNRFCTWQSWSICKYSIIYSWETRM